nr:Na-translocating system protein MpsC family protein [Argonema antarcticum]
MENAISRPVQLLAENDRLNLAQQVRSNVDAAIKPQFVQVIEEILHIPVVDLRIATTIETGRTGIIAVLDVSPRFSDVAVPPQVKPDMVCVDNDK